MEGVSSSRPSQPTPAQAMARYPGPSTPSSDEPTGWEKTGLQLIADIEILKATLRASRRSTMDANHRAEVYLVALTDSRYHAEAYRDSSGAVFEFPWEV